jgi:hypothetical protein
MPGFLNISTVKACSGLALRPLSNTITDILEWDAQRVNSQQFGLSREKEQVVLKLWQLENMES